MTNDMISRQAAIEGKMNILVRCDDDKLRFKDVVPIEYLQNMPSAEPEVVRCKECMYYDLFPNGANGMCEKHIDAMAVFYPWDFCSYAERREEELS